VSTAANTPLFNRPDTLLGVCEGIGREFGIHPNILRIGLAVPMIWNPVAVIGTYFGLGAALWLSHKIAPNRRGTTVEPANAEAGEQEMALAA
jgi:phage shock protein PspC (stress-responsive transcriptional regulator)